MLDHSYNTDHNYESGVPMEYGLLIKDALFEKLYVPQINYWNKRLRELSERNVAAYAREDECFNLDQQSFVSIFHEGVSYGLLAYDEDDDPISPYCLEIAPDKELREQMQVTAEELQKLTTERYEVQRFLSGLMLFDPPPVTLEKVLGDGLYRICQNILHKVGRPAESLNWELREPAAFQTFLDEHQSTISAMQERMLLNMITI